MATLPSSVLDFLAELRQHNNRDWFAEHKPRYQEAHAHVKSFFEDLHGDLSQHDEIEPAKLMRIYRDVRFSKDKTPYSPRLSGSFRRIGAERRGGYYLHIEPGNSMIAIGFWAPEKDDLMRIRKEIELQPEFLLEAMNEKRLLKYFGPVQGDGLKTAPRGFAKDHPQIELLRKKQFYYMKSLSDKQVTSKNFHAKVLEGFLAARPFFDAMSEVLTTDLNGEPL